MSHSLNKSPNQSLDTVLDQVPLTCPHDGLRLHRFVQSLRCSAGHSFDIARQGYVNLLPVAHKASRHPGDSAQMVQARARIMGSGLFDPVATALAEVVASRCGPGLIVDAGCGDGWFTQRVLQLAQGPRLLALDVSKDAIRAAARRSASASDMAGQFACVVASSKALPVASGAINTLLCVFGFPFWSHWSEHPCQRVITVDPGPDHLLELREAIYPEVRRHAAPAHEQALVSGYKLVHTEGIVTPNGQVDAWLDLLDMTPHGRRCSSEARERLAAAASGKVRLDVMLKVYEKADPPQECVPR